jgi:hypothetical protein
MPFYKLLRKVDGF